jgi:hypothetical protein
VDYETAVNLILMHGIGRDDVPLKEALIPDGFLSSLRPYTGLREENFLQVLGAIIALAPHLAGRLVLERRLIYGLWELISLARSWGLDPAGMLQRNRLLTPAETARLGLWVECLEMAVSRLLRGNDPGDALTRYRDLTTE